MSILILKAFTMIPGLSFQSLPLKEGIPSLPYYLSFLCHLRLRKCVMCTLAFFYDTNKNATTPPDRIGPKRGHFLGKKKFHLTKLEKLKYIKVVKLCKRLIWVSIKTQPFENLPLVSICLYRGLKTTTFRGIKMPYQEESTYLII